MSIAIVGAGIGGLTTALFLKKQGIPFQIYEQASEIRPVGAGIILAHNAMQVFDRLGLKRAISELGNPLTSINIDTSNLRTINRINTQHFDEKYSVQSVAIHRGALQKFLIEQLPANSIHLNKKVTDVKTDINTTLVFSEGDELECDAVIAADGINSVIRNTLFTENVIRKPNQTCWRGVANLTLPKTIESELHELWGYGSRFGFVKISSNQVYWYALHATDQKPNRNELANHFANYDSIVSKIISETHIENIFESEVSDLKPISSWCKNAICLLGDAAHATTPNMGQGACQAIEDAYVISHYLSKHAPDIAFEQYQQIRKRKTNMVVNLSWGLGYISHIKNPIIAAIRNFVMRATPASISTRQSERLYTLDKL